MKRILSSTISLLLLSSALLAADKPSKSSPAAPPPDEAAMMNAWTQAMAPGEQHHKLDVFIGSFDAKVKSWMKAGDAPAESTGTSENKWILGGRYVQQEFTGSFMGMPFSGVGYTGYDNIRHQFVATWMDNMSTAPMITTGQGDATAVTMSGNLDDPLTSKSSLVRQKITIVDHDHLTMEMWGVGMDGKEMKMMEINYTRRK